jgi:hypothetical protein
MLVARFLALSGLFVLLGLLAVLARNPARAKPQTV